MIFDVNAYDKLEVKLIPDNEIEEIIQNVKTILQTVKGTVPYDRDFGISSQLLDNPIDTVKAKLSAEIAAAVAKFEPRARVTDINYQADINGRVAPSVKIRIVEKNLRGGI